MSNLQRSIRLLGRTESSLNSISTNPGEIFYDTTNQTLRVYNQSGPSILATEEYVDTAVNNIDLSNIDLSGLDLTGYATETYVTTRGYITSSALANYALTSAIPTNNNQLTNGAGFITSSALANYALTSAIPTNNNQLTNGAGYITSSSLTGLATESFVGTAVSNLIDAAPTALNTLNELAAALNDDANFATTVTTALGTKAPINNPTFTGTVGGVTATMVGLGNVTNESKATMFTNPTFTGTTTLQQSTEVMNTINGATGTVTHDFSTGAVWRHFPSADFTANFTNVPTTFNRAIAVTLIIIQSTTAYIPNAVQIDGIDQTIRWQDNTIPTGNAGRGDVFSFVLLRGEGSWTVLGSMSTYG